MGARARRIRRRRTRRAGTTRAALRARHVMPVTPPRGGPRSKTKGRRLPAEAGLRARGQGPGGPPSGRRFPEPGLQCMERRSFPHTAAGQRRIRTGFPFHFIFLFG
ncbi:Hypothetical protein I596_443 [Dokdonella koreensis DS-123]|uniref:Uncharacterized protein n=1 Tax=Dokdonella koreensis DS-123 TaxID=1300342 RepID=A0A161HJ00_9GAMM|nr:Hypothetical protein I596_443 [Dokdonella koreensis DS-123]